MRDLFDTDFPDKFAYGGDGQFTNNHDQAKIIFRYRVLGDFFAKTKFLAFLLP